MKKSMKKIPAKGKPAARHNGLGRGFDALIGGPSPAPAAPVPARPALAAAIAKPAPAPEEPPRDGRVVGSVLKVPTAEIVRSPWQPRQFFDEAALADLAESIKANGIIQPLLCRRLDDGRFELIGGERRLRAAGMAGLEQVPVILIEAEDRKAAELAIVENIQRADLNAIEEAEGYRTLTETFGLSQGDVADRVGKARTTIVNAMRLLDLPDETKAMVADGRLSTGQAKAILGLPRTEDRIRLGRRAVSENLTVRALERIVTQLTTPLPDPARAAAKNDLPPAYLRDLTDRLHARFGTAVRVTSGRTLPNGRHAKGTLEVDFYDNADLDRILALLGVKMD